MTASPVLAIVTDQRPTGNASTGPLHRRPASRFMAGGLNASCASRSACPECSSSRMRMAHDSATAPPSPRVPWRKPGPEQAAAPCAPRRGNQPVRQNPGGVLSPVALKQADELQQPPLVEAENRTARAAHVQTGRTAARSLFSEPFLRALGHASRRRLHIGFPGCSTTTGDDRRILTVVAAARADDSNPAGNPTCGGSSERNAATDAQCRPCVGGRNSRRAPCTCRSATCGGARANEGSGDAVSEGACSSVPPIGGSCRYPSPLAHDLVNSGTKKIASAVRRQHASDDAGADVVLARGPRSGRDRPTERRRR